jgi:Zn-dependent protease with chaperone function
VSEAAFPLLGASFVMLFVLPASALLAKAGLCWLERAPHSGPLQHLSLRYLLLTGATLLPLAWFSSAGLHQLESGQSGLTCLIEHAAAEACLEPGFFALALGLLVLGRAAPVVLAARGVRPAPGVAAAGLALRVEGIIAQRPMLRALRGRIVITEAAGFALGTQGWLRPRVVVGSAFAAACSNEMLASALGHENEHVRRRDPLRYLLLHVTLAVSPFGRRLLEPHAARWLAAHEAHCDREAVLHGAPPLPLADAILRAARPSRWGAALGAHDGRWLEFRVGMLLAFAEQRPVLACRREPSGLLPALVLFALALLAPHHASTAALDVLHTGAEHAVSALLP